MNTTQWTASDHPEVPREALPIDPTHQGTYHRRPMCDGVASQGYGCTRFAGHTGRHAGAGVDGRILAVWP